MNKRQAKRIVMATEASYILFGASTDSVTDLLNEKDHTRFCEAQHDLAYELLRRAGFDEPMHAHEIVAAVIGRNK